MEAQGVETACASIFNCMRFHFSLLALPFFAPSRSTSDGGTETLPASALSKAAETAGGRNVKSFQQKRLLNYE
ncbi:hypothetical protein [Bacteroides helcogenes]|uniref:hypothetical protein n=1 Tax=Bacteroides helcogenes TaxID=290053 RepID=UPI0003052ECF|nr:hypothetical protein [Bacteroides helcogenes]MDY5239082.1 hypothetical protein [Bacteroides helcogenes]